MRLEPKAASLNGSSSASMKLADRIRSAMTERVPGSRAAWSSMSRRMPSIRATSVAYFDAGRRLDAGVAA